MVYAILWIRRIIQQRELLYVYSFYSALILWKTKIVISLWKTGIKRNCCTDFCDSNFIGISIKLGPQWLTLVKLYAKWIHKFYIYLLSNRTQHDEIHKWQRSHLWTHKQQHWLVYSVHLLLWNCGIAYL